MPGRRDRYAKAKNGRVRECGGRQKTVEGRRETRRERALGGLRQGEMGVAVAVATCPVFGQNKHRQRHQPAMSIRPPRGFNSPHPDPHLSSSFLPLYLISTYPSVSLVPIHVHERSTFNPRRRQSHHDYCSRHPWQKIDPTAHPYHGPYVQ